MYRKKMGNKGNLLDLASSNIKDDTDFQTLQSLFKALKIKYMLSSSELIHYLDEKDIFVPDCIFNKKLSIFQSIVKFLKENCKLKNKDIADLLHKSQKSIWQAYNYTKKRFPSHFRIIASKYLIPISCFTPSLTVLESVVVYLKEKWLLNYHQIALLLKRDDRTIWTVYQKVKKRKYLISPNIKQDVLFQELRLLFNKLKRRYGLYSLELLNFLDEKEILLPDNIFSKKLSVSQSIVKYLRENLSFKNIKIAPFLHKSQKSIWQAYNFSKKKLPSKFMMVPSKYLIPISCFTPSLTVLESVVVYLKEKWLLNYHQIALLLKRDDRTIWTVYQRVKKKRR